MKSLMMYSKKNKIENIGVISIFVVMFVYASFAYYDSNFLTTTSLLNLLQKSILDGGLLALGMTAVLLVGDIDLSVGATMALSGVICATMTEYGFMPAIVCGLLCGAVIGLVNGIIVAKFNVVPFVGTFATQLFVRAIAYKITDYSTVIVSDNTEFSQLIKVSVGNFPVYMILFFVIVALMIYITKYTKLGIRMYAVGGNSVAAQMMGLNVTKIRITAYIICGMFASASGILTVARAKAGSSIAGDGYEMTAIACAALGGVSLAGGKGNYVGTLFGLMIMGLISTIFNYQGNIGTWWKNILMGVILIVSVLVQSDLFLKNVKLKRRKENE